MIKSHLLPMETFSAKQEFCVFIIINQQNSGDEIQKENLWLNALSRLRKKFLVIRKVNHLAHPVLGDISDFRIFLPLIKKNVFEKLASYHRRGANTLLVTVWLKVFIKIAI